MFEIRQIFVLLNFCPCRCSWTHEKYTDERHALKLTIADVNLVKRHRFTKGDVHPYDELELTYRPGGRRSQRLVVERVHGETLVDVRRYKLCTPGGGLACRLPPTYRLYTPGKGLARCLPPVYMWPHVRCHINIFIVHMSTPDILVHHVYGFIRNHMYGYIDNSDTCVKPCHELFESRDVVFTNPPCHITVQIS